MNNNYTAVEYSVTLSSLYAAEGHFMYATEVIPCVLESFVRNDPSVMYDDLMDIPAGYMEWGTVEATMDHYDRLVNCATVMLDELYRIFLSGLNDLLDRYSVCTVRKFSSDTNKIIIQLM